MTSVIAHRGASAVRPENTVEAFVEAARLGADGVELDVRRSADRRLMVCHDSVYPDGRRVFETASADRPSAVCDLPEALDACGDLLVNVEIKNIVIDPDYEPDAPIADAVVDLLVARGRLERFLVSSFDLRTIDRVHELAPSLPTAFLFFIGIDRFDAIDLAARHGHVAIHPHDHMVDEHFVTAGHEAGLAVNVWTVNDADRISELGAFGVDAVVTDVPDVARAALGRV